MAGKFDGRLMTGASPPEYYMAKLALRQTQDIQLLSVRSVLEQAISTVFAISVPDLRSRHRRAARTAFARQAAMYLAHVVFGLTLTRVGTVFGRDRTTVAHGCAVVEDRREDPVLDRALTIVESALRTACQRGTLPGGVWE